MDETLKTLRLLHLTILGLSAAIVVLAQGEITDSTGALHELSVLRTMANDVDEIGTYYALCDKETIDVLSNGLPTFRQQFQRILKADGRNLIKLADGFTIRAFGFCDGPPINGSLEAYEHFFLDKQMVFLPMIGDHTFRRVLEGAAGSKIYVNVRPQCDPREVTSVELKPASIGSPSNPFAVRFNYQRETRSLEGLRSRPMFLSISVSNKSGGSFGLT